MPCMTVQVFGGFSKAFCAEFGSESDSALVDGHEVDARIVHTLHDEIIVEGRDGIAGQESLGLDPALFERDCGPASTKPWCGHFEDKNPVYDYENGIMRF